MTPDEIEVIRERWRPKAGIYKGLYFPEDSLVITASIGDALRDIPILLTEIERLRDTLADAAVILEALNAAVKCELAPDVKVVIAAVLPKIRTALA